MIGKFIFSNGKWSANLYFQTVNDRQIFILKRQISANFYFEIANNWLIFILQVVLDEGRKVAGRSFLQKCSRNLITRLLIPATSLLIFLISQ